MTVRWTVRAATGFCRSKTKSLILRGEKERTKRYVLFLFVGKLGFYHRNGNFPFSLSPNIKLRPLEP